MTQRVLVILLLFSLRVDFGAAYGQTTKLVVAYASPAATFCPGWIARREGICERATFLLAPDRRVVAGAVHPIGFPRPLALLREWLARSGLS